MTRYAKLNNWAIVGRATDWAQTPELMVQCLNGDVEGHTKFNDGTNITTTQIKGKFNDLVVTDNDSLYGLGEVNDEYEGLYPDSRNRLFNSLPELKFDSLTETYVDLSVEDPINLTNRFV